MYVECIETFRINTEYKNSQFFTKGEKYKINKTTCKFRGGFVKCIATINDYKEDHVILINTDSSRAFFKKYFQLNEESSKEFFNEHFQLEV